MEVLSAPRADSLRSGGTIGQVQLPVEADTPIERTVTLWAPGEASGPTLIQLTGRLQLGARALPIATLVTDGGVLRYENTRVTLTRKPVMFASIQDPGDLVTIVALDFALVDFVAIRPDGTRTHVGVRNRPEAEGDTVRFLDPGAAAHGLEVVIVAGGTTSLGFPENIQHPDCAAQVFRCLPLPPEDPPYFSDHSASGQVELTAFGSESLVTRISVVRHRIPPVLYRCFLASTQVGLRLDRHGACVAASEVDFSRRDTTTLRLSARLGADGPAPDSVRVWIVSDPVPGSGGHAHTEDRPRGTFFPGPGPAVDQPAGGSRDSVQLTLKGRTDTTLVYRSSGIGGYEVLDVRATGFTRGDTLEASAADTVAVRLAEDLVRLPSIPGVLEPIGPTMSHPQNTWGTERTVEILENIANGFFGATRRPLEVNDMSLPFGGLFDCAVGFDSECTTSLGRENPWRPPHKTHRRGDQADIRNNNLVDRSASPPDSTDWLDLKLVIRQSGGSIYQAEEATHFHTTFSQ